MFQRLAARARSLGLGRSTPPVLTDADAASLEWLFARDAASLARVDKLLSAEEAYARSAVIAPLRSTARALEAAMARFSAHEVTAAPERLGEWEYLREAGDNEHSLVRLVRRRVGESRSELVLDVNAVVRAHAPRHVSVDTLRVCPAATSLAYTVKKDGADLCELHIAPIPAKQAVARLVNVCGFDWLTREALAYTTPRTASASASVPGARGYEPILPGRVMLHRLGTRQADDVTLYEETEPNALVSVHRSKDSTRLFITSMTLDSSVVYTVDAARPTAARPIRLLERRADVSYFAETVRAPPDELVITSAGRDGGRLALWPSGTALGELGGMHVLDWDVQHAHVVCYGKELELGRPEVRVVSLDSRRTARVAIDAAVLELAPLTNADPSARTVQFTGWSPVCPPRTYTAACDGTAPALIRAYGAYGALERADFSPANLALAARGWTVVTAHIRGGSERGMAWHTAGSGERKGASAQDLLAVARELVASGLAARELVCATALSAGGVAVGGAMNLDPSAFCAVVLHVPFLNLCAPRDSLSDYDGAEWGPRPELWCPSANLAARAGAPWPAMLLTTSRADRRVSAAIPLAYLARVRRALGADASRHCALVVDERAAPGHAGATNTRDRCASDARDMAFLEQAVARQRARASA